MPASYLPGVTVRLRSALPIRQALLRLKQIEAKYDNMSENDRADFDARMKGLIDCPACGENYIITLGPPVSQRQEHRSGAVRSACASVAWVAAGCE